MFVGLAGAEALFPVVPPWFTSLHCMVVVAIAPGCSMFVPGLGARGGGGVAVLCMSSLQFTLEVLNLVFLVGAGDGEMGGEGESSPAIVGINRAG